MQRELMYKVKVILNHVILELLHQQRSIAHLTDEFVVREILPGGFDVFMVEDVFYEGTPADILALKL